MKRLVVTVSRLELPQDELTQGFTVSFRVLQRGKLLLADSISGKISVPYRRVYEVNATDDEIVIEHDCGYVECLIISADFEP